MEGSLEITYLGLWGKWSFLGGRSPDPCHHTSKSCREGGTREVVKNGVSKGVAKMSQKGGHKMSGVDRQFHTRSQDGVDRQFHTRSQDGVDRQFHTMG